MSFLAGFQQILSSGLGGVALVLINHIRSPGHEPISYLAPIAFALIAIAVKP